MKFVKKTAPLSLVAALVACGGSGGSGGSSENSAVLTEEEALAPQLVLAFENEPLEPNVFNIEANAESEELDFYPGDQIRTSWFMTLRYDNGTDLLVGESHLYDASVYLSTDNIIDNLDLELFTLECSFPETPEHACGRFASFSTVYAPDNDARFSTTSIPIGKSLGLSAYDVDSTDWLSFIPRDATLIINACLREEPDKCDTFSVVISLL